MIRHALLASVAIVMTIGMTTGCANSEDRSGRSLFDFSNPEAVERWSAVNDGVMGGLSQGGPAFENGAMRFSGQLSLENNGGFSSVRHDADLDLSEFKGVRVRVKGDGRSYQLRIQTDARYRGRPVSFSAEFATEDGEWTKIDVPFDALGAGFRGRSLNGYEFDSAKIQSISLMLADKQPGPFSVEVEWIQAYR